MREKKLGYTWYPQNYISDPEVMMMTPSQRGIFRDLMDLAYMNNNAIPYTIAQLSKYTNATEDEVLEVLEMKGEKRGDFWSIPSCQARLDAAKRNQENGKKGGRPKSKKTTIKNPKENPPLSENETQPQRQRERERERERENKREYSKARPRNTQEVSEYMRSLGILDFKKEGEKFWDFYSSNGWKIGGRSAMKDWQAAVRNWKRNVKYKVDPDQMAQMDEHDIRSRLLQMELS